MVGVTEYNTRVNRGLVRVRCLLATPGHGVSLEESWLQGAEMCGACQLPLLPRMAESRVTHWGFLSAQGVSLISYLVEKVILANL